MRIADIGLGDGEHPVRRHLRRRLQPPLRASSLGQLVDDDDLGGPPPALPLGPREALRREARGMMSVVCGAVVAGRAPRRSR
ncbi:hypothetical protein [Streptomyces hokutonensis]|uniref:hypothetical protein n=1 Tax=Streptomyces hokutonensis TaxID=1306990 RepID=UPI0033E9729A